MKTIFLAFVYTAVFVFCTDCVPDLSVSGPVTVDGNNVSYDRNMQVLSASGNVVVEYMDMRLTADTIKLQVEKKEISASGNVRLYRAGNIYQADNIVYNFETGTADIMRCKYNVPPIYGSVERVGKIDDKVFVADNASVTTSDFDEPEYRIEGKYIEIYLGDRVVVKDAVVYMGKVPVFYWPYYSRSLEDDKPKFFVVPGHDSEWGTFVLTGVNWKLDKNIKGTSRIDYRSRRGIAWGTDIKYKQDRIQGEINTYHAFDKNRELDDGTHIHDNNRYRLKWKHRQILADDITFFAEFNKQSDKDIIKDFFRKEYSREIQSRTHGEIAKYGDKFKIGVSARKRLNTFYNVVERLPQVNIDLANQKLWETPIYYESSNSAAYLNYDKEFQRHREYSSGRVDTFHRFCLPVNYFDALSVNPYAEYRGTFYTNAVDEQNDIMRNVFTAGVETSTKFYRVFNVEHNFFDIHDIRHVFQPQVVYTYTYKPDKRPDEIYQFDWIDSIDRRETLRYGFRNTFQTKRNNVSVDLLNLYIYIDMFLKKDRDNDGDRFSNLFSELEFRPFNWMYLNLDSSFNSYSGQFDEVNSNIGLSPIRNVGISFGQRYLKDYSNLWTTSFYMRFLEKWRFDTYLRFETSDGELQEQEYKITRNFHCWETSFSYAKRGDENMFYISFWLTAFPESQAEVGY
ncbi:MAG: LPS assembly protein LptD [bacterium]|nr:LPS assembly protein LptD [bacterium]